MIFSSLLFIFIFLPSTLIIYYLSPKKFKNLVLLISSLIFYGWGEPLYILIMLFSTVFDYINGLMIDKYRKNKHVSRAVFLLSIIVNLRILGFFKYYGFLINNINDLFNLSIKIKQLPLPVGISFYTFQTMSYVIDVYLEKVEVQKSIISFGTYVTMFPQLVAGPIVKYGDIDKQINNRKESFLLLTQGIERFIIGLSKKVLLANGIGVLWNIIKVTPLKELSVLSSWIGIMAFTFQIYFDFSGYSDMAIGLGKMFGFDIMENFNYPYISASVTEFWRRWHISLGLWFKEYVYIPLGGNRKGKLKQFRNLFVVWFLTGFWHGANWNFITWGLYFGIFICLEKEFLLKFLNNKPKFIGHIYTLIVVMIGWVLFELENTGQALSYIKTMFGLGKVPFINSSLKYYLSTNWILIIFLIICSTPIPKKLFKKLRARNSICISIILSVFMLILLMLCVAYLVNETYNPFLYFRF